MILLSMFCESHSHLTILHHERVPEMSYHGQHLAALSAHAYEHPYPHICSRFLIQTCHIPRRENGDYITIIYLSNNNLNNTQP
jgi:hypothetical protein